MIATEGSGSPWLRSQGRRHGAAVSSAAAMGPSSSRRPRLLRRLTWLVTAIAAVLAVPAPALAHGLGGRRDLPVPIEFFVVGAAVVLVASFAALAVLWPKPRWQETPAGRPIAAPWLGPVATFLKVLGVAGLVAVVVSGAFAGLARDNLAPVVVWIYFWLVIPFASAVLGNLWRFLNPWRSLAAWGSIGEVERPELLARVGVWPAAAAFVAFTWLELVWPDSARPTTLAIAAIVYTFWVLAMAGYAGRETGMVVGEAFTTYNGLLSAISPLGPRPGGGLEWRGWLRRLPHLPLRPGIVAFVVAMIGTVTYDGLSATQGWRDLVGDLAAEEWFGTVALVGTVAAVGAGYWVASWAAARLSGQDVTAAAVARSFAHTLVPIAFAYAFAHYFTLVAFEGQLLIPALSDPLGRGWDLLGTADYQVNFFLSSDVVWYVQVATIVGGHVAGVVLAHDRALADFGPVRGVRTQYAMLGLMVALTMLGLVLLSS